MTVQLKLPKSAGLRGCCQIPAASARSRLSERLAVLLRQRGGVQARRRGSVSKILEKELQNAVGRGVGGGECENTQADAKPSFHSHANTFTRFLLCQCTMWLSGYKSCSIHVQNGVETAFWHSSMLVSIAHPPLTHRRPSNVRSGQMCLHPHSCCPDTGLTSFLFSLCVFWLAPAACA